MISLKAEKNSEGIGVESEFVGKGGDLGLEALHLIAVLIREMKGISPEIYGAIVSTLAGCPEILAGDYKGDETIVRGKMN